MEIFSVGAGFVKISGVETDLFLTIDDTGTLRATVNTKYRIGIIIIIMINDRIHQVVLPLSYI